jgi:hypothetical protein
VTSPLIRPGIKWAHDKTSRPHDRSGDRGRPRRLLRQRRNRPNRKPATDLRRPLIRGTFDQHPFTQERRSLAERRHPITITAGDRTITATLNNSDVAQDFAKMLPVTLPWFRNLDIEYITELSAPITETGPFYTDVEAGDLVYYNPLDSITIIYAPTSSVPTLTKMGEITSDLSVFEDLPDDVDMRIEVG